MPELADLSGKGAKLDLNKVPVEESGMSPLEIWCNESQERYSLAIDPARLEQFDQYCKRERCPYAVLGEISADARSRRRTRRGYADERLARQNAEDAPRCRTRRTREDGNG